MSHLSNSSVFIHFKNDRPNFAGNLGNLDLCWFSILILNIRKQLLSCWPSPKTGESIHQGISWLMLGSLWKHKVALQILNTQYSNTRVPPTRTYLEWMTSIFVEQKRVVFISAVVLSAEHHGQKGFENYFHSGSCFCVKGLRVSKKENPKTFLTTSESRCLKHYYVEYSTMLLFLPLSQYPSN